MQYSEESSLQLLSEWRAVCVSDEISGNQPKNIIVNTAIKSLRIILEIYIFES